VGHIPVAKPSPIPRWKFPRRGLALSCILAGTVALIVVGLVAARPTGPNVDGITVPGWVTVADVDELQTDQPLRIYEQKLWLVKLDSGEMVALSQKGYRGCTVGWRTDFTVDGVKGWFRDPCQGVTYDLNGYKLYGPAPRGMDQYEVKIVNREVQVRVGPGAVIENAPAEAAPYRPR
jgi:hypothetical protein